MRLEENRPEPHPAGGVEQVEFPEDLREWVDERTLLSSTLEAVHHIPLAALQSKEFPGPMLLTLLAYAYAIGVCDSREIERRMKEDPILSYICSPRDPDWNTLRLFRRRHSALLKAVLIRLFRQVRNRRPISEDYLEFSLARWRKLGLEEELAAEAESRIQKAICFDTMALDE